MPRINALQAFYVDHNLGQSDEQLSKTTGLTVGQVKSRRLKVVGRNREGKMKGTPEEKRGPQPNREAELINEAQKAAALEKCSKTVEPVVQETRPKPSMRIDQLLVKGKGTVAMTGPASELADLFDGISPDSKKRVEEPSIYEREGVHRIK